jgi:NitT/TauT family transport system permease protein
VSAHGREALGELAGTKAEAPGRGGRTLPAAVREYGPATMFVVLGIAAWEVVWLWVRMPEYLFPRPSVIGVTLVRRFWLIYPHALWTLTEVLVGFVAGVFIGFLLAMLVFYSRLAARILYPLAVFSQTVPKLAVAPLFVIWLGFGIAPKIAIIVLLVMFPVLVNTIDGFRSVDPRLIDLMRSLSASEAQIFRYIRFPAALPFIFSALKIATTLAVIGAVVGEWIGASRGLGYLILTANSLVDIPLLFAVLVTLSIMGLAFFGGIFFWERIALYWQSDE